MHLHFSTALVVTALAASIVLVVNGERMFALIALIAAALEALIAFHVLSVAVAHVPLDKILPAAVLVGAGVTWGRASERMKVTAATAAIVVSAIQLLLALHVLD